ncbi:MAG: sigma-70 family RNA polymerase sigma factor [Planctomycetales bacterium]|nr:sigma-70 family RNA polymerase sigma factor [Planctomycetales bacterium]
MPSSVQDAEVLLSQALSGSRECFGRLLSLYRNYLKLLVVAQLEKTLRRRLSPSDVVQETFLEANRDFGQFRGTSAGEFCAWLRRILVNNVHRAVEQHVLAAKRSVHREVSLDAVANSLEQSTVRLDSILAESIASPSARLQQNEQQLALANCLASLPADYREVIVLRHLQSLPFEAIGQHMERSAGAVRMIWLRAIRELRERMIDASETAGETP